MELVIKIPEDDYINIKNAINSLIKYGVERDSMSQVCLAILDGKPLPKGHGRLVDQEILFENLFRRNVFQNITLQELSQLIKEATVIEADREKAEWDNVDKR